MRGDGHVQIVKYDAGLVVIVGSEGVSVSSDSGWGVAVAAASQVWLTRSNAVLLAHQEYGAQST